MTTPPRTRTVTDVDKDLAHALRKQRAVRGQIEHHLEQVRHLRTQFAQEGNRLNRLLDERSSLTHPPTT